MWGLVRVDDCLLGGGGVDSFLGTPPTTHLHTPPTHHTTPQKPKQALSQGVHSPGLLALRDAAFRLAPQAVKGPLFDFFIRLSLARCVVLFSIGRRRPAGRWACLRFLGGLRCPIIIKRRPSCDPPLHALSQSTNELTIQDARRGMERGPVWVHAGAAARRGGVEEIEIER